MRRLIMAVLLGSTALVPSAFAQTTETQPAAGDSCEQLVTLLRDNPQTATAAGITAGGVKE